jgi:hypothetical protein
MLEFAGVMSGVDPTLITTYQINADPTDHPGQRRSSCPRSEGDNMQAVLAVFRGLATLGDAPVQVLTLPNTLAGATKPASHRSGHSPDHDRSERHRVPRCRRVHADENLFGVVPDKNVSC